MNKDRCSTSAPVIADALAWANNTMTHHSLQRSMAAVWLLEHCTGNSASYLYAHDRTKLTAKQWRYYRQSIERHCAGEPMAYICGHSVFRGQCLKVDARVLIPRPETEQLLDFVLDSLSPDCSEMVADLGTGSGAIAIALANARPHLSVCATDCSQNALEVATDNVRAAGLEQRISIRCGHWCDALGCERDLALVVSNPPYVNADEPALSVAPLNYEPRAALATGIDGMEALLAIIATAGAHMRPGASLWLEHAAGQAQQVQQALHQHGWCDVRGECDWEGRSLFSHGMRAP